MQQQPQPEPVTGSQEPVEEPRAPQEGLGALLKSMRWFTETSIYINVSNHVSHGQNTRRSI